MDNRQIAQQLNVGRIQVGRSRERFAEGGLAAIEAVEMYPLKDPKELYFARIRWPTT